MKSLLTIFVLFSSFGAVSAPSPMEAQPGANQIRPDALPSLFSYDPCSSATCSVALHPAVAEARARSSSSTSPFATVRGREGYWRIARTTGGVWWFLSPEDKPEFLNLVTTVQPVVHGRDASGPDFISNDYDAQSPPGLDHWAKATIRRVTETGFKGIGAWSDPILHQYAIPMTQDLNISSWAMACGAQLFSPSWQRAAEQAIQNQVTPLRENKNLIGYYLDNEMNWDDDSTGPGVFFDGNAEDDPNRREVEKVIRETFPSVTDFNRSFNLQLADYSSLGTLKSLPRTNASGYERLASAWLSHLAESYFRITSSFLRKIDPNHLILGIRYRGTAPVEVVRASRRWTDVQSLNYYVSDARLDPDTFKMIGEESQQPIVISEYSFHALDGRSGDRNLIGFDAQVVDQQARADAYRQFTSRVARVPNIIGADWFQWADEPASGRAADSEDVNFGIVDIDDLPYQLLVDAVRETSAQLDGLHEHSAADRQEDVWRQSFAVNRPVARIPSLDHRVRLAGRLDRWSNTSKLSPLHPALAVGTERFHLPPPNVYMGWTTQGLYLAFEVFDNDISAAPAGGWWWARDSVEFWISTRPPRPDQSSYDAYCHHFFFVPVDYPTRDGVAGVVGQWHSPGDTLKDNLIPHPDIRQVTRILSDRYVVEMFIPAKALYGYDPVHHPQIAFNFHARNYQHAAEYYWSAPKQVLTQARPNTWGLVYLEPPAGSINAQQPIAGTASEVAK